MFEMTVKIQCFEVCFISDVYQACNCIKFLGIKGFQEKIIPISKCENADDD